MKLQIKNWNMKRLCIQIPTHFFAKDWWGSAWRAISKLWRSYPSRQTWNFGKERGKYQINLIWSICISETLSKQGTIEISKKTRRRVSWCLTCFSSKRETVKSKEELWQEEIRKGTSSPKKIPVHQLYQPKLCYCPVSYNQKRKGTSL